MQIVQKVRAERKKGRERCAHAWNGAIEGHREVAEILGSEFEESVASPDVDSDIAVEWQPAIAGMALMLCEVLIIKPDNVNEVLAHEKFVQHMAQHPGVARAVVSAAASNDQSSRVIDELMQAFPGTTYASQEEYDR